MDYHDLDMSGLEPSWYERVPIGVQETVNTFPGDQLRVLWNGGKQCFTVIAQNADRSGRQKWWGGWLRGWSVVMHWEFPLGDGSKIRECLGRMVRLTEFYEDKEKHQDEVDRQIDAANEKRQKEADAQFDDFWQSEAPDGLLQERAIARDFEKGVEKELDEQHWVAKGGSRNAAPSHLKLLLPTGNGKWMEKEVT